MVFQSTYQLLGMELACNIVQVPTPFKLEKDTYTYIRSRSVENGWKFLRIDTIDQIGYPDISIFREDTYNLIECKLLRKKQLASIEDDLHFEFGQLQFAVRAIKLNLNYTLAVGKGNQLAFIQGHYNKWNIAY